MWPFFINALYRSLKALSSYIFMSKDHRSPNRSWVIFYKNGENALQYDHLVFHFGHIPAELSIKWNFFLHQSLSSFISKHLSYVGSKTPTKRKKLFLFLRQIHQVVGQFANKSHSKYLYQTSTLTVLCQNMVTSSLESISHQSQGTLFSSEIFMHLYS